MRKTLILGILMATFIITVGSSMLRTVLKNTLNIRLDSNASSIVNSIDTKIYKDFHDTTLPQVLLVTPETFKYATDTETVVLRNNGDYIELVKEDRLGKSWSSQVKGRIEVQEVEVVNLEGIKVEVANTGAKIYTISYYYYEDRYHGRVSMNRNFTRVIAIPREG